jgi:hypothetical protein
MKRPVCMINEESITSDQGHEWHVVSFLKYLLSQLKDKEVRIDWYEFFWRGKK